VSPYLGTVRFASARVLDMLEQDAMSFLVTPQDDLESFVKTFFALKYPQAMEQLNMGQREPSRYKALWAGWLGMLQHWNAVVEAAQSCNYEEVKQQLPMLMR
jgi:hypothetical protein